MTKTATKTECTCGGGACAVRHGRGLVPFCQMDRIATPHYSPEAWPTYSAAAVANPGKRIQGVGGGLTGASKRFVVR